MLVRVVDSSFNSHQDLGQGMQYLVIWKDLLRRNGLDLFQQESLFVVKLLFVCSNVMLVGSI